MITRNQPDYTTAQVFKSDDGYSVANFHATGLTALDLYSDNGESIVKLNSFEPISLAKKLEGFLANSLNFLGIKEIAGFKTRRNIGTGELFAPDGQSQGATKVWGKGFQRK